MMPRGLYLWGPVGCGKSMLMDLFKEEMTGVLHQGELAELPQLPGLDWVSTAPSDEAPFPWEGAPAGDVPATGMARVHFHSFMAAVHRRLRTIRSWLIETEGRVLHAGQDRQPDAVSLLGREIASHTWLLCFDEMQVTDVADAIIVSRLFRELFSHGCVVLTTSNRPPKDLYANGLNRESFLPFIELLEQQVRVHHLPSSTDYRHELAAGSDIRHRNVPAAVHGSTSLQLGIGRALSLELIDGETAVVTFDQLCSSACGPSDFRTLCSAFPAVMVTGVPALEPPYELDAAKRLVTLVDEAYEAPCVLHLDTQAQSQSAVLDGVRGWLQGRPVHVEHFLAADDDRRSVDPAADAPTSGNAALDELRVACGRAGSRLAQMESASWAEHVRRTLRVQLSSLSDR